MNRTLCGLVTAAAVSTGGLLCTSPAQASNDVTINLVAVNDFHGQIDGKVVQWAATVEQLLADGSADNTLLISAGDNVGDSAPASKAQDDNPTIDVLNVLGVDASAVGNHEFDRGYSDLVNRIMARADFPILGANVTKSDGSAALDASTMYTVSGVRIAVVGAVTASTPELVNPSGIAGLTFGDPVTGINAEVDRLNALPESERPEVIVAAIHEGAPWGTWTLEQAMQSSSTFTRVVEETSPDVDAMIMGHTHNTYVFNAPVPGDPSRTRPMIQTGYHGQNVGQIKLTIDADTGEVTAHTARNVPRVTTSDEDLIPTDPKLGTIAKIRDDAVAFAAAQVEQAAAVQVELDEAQTAGEAAYAEAERLKNEYDAAVTARNEAYATATGAKKAFDAAVSAGQAGYADATRIKQAQEAAVLEARADYATATSIKQAYEAEVATGKAAYATAATIKQSYLVAVAEGKESYAAATRIKMAYDAEVATGKAAYATASSIKQTYEEAVAEGKAAYALAATIKEQYLATMAMGDPDSNLLLPGLAQQYYDAVAAGDAAYARAKSIAMAPDYDAAITAGKAAYAKAIAMVPDYDAAITAGKVAYAEAAALKPVYDAAATLVKDATAHVSAVKELYDAAIATLNELRATIASLEDELLGLL